MKWVHLIKNFYKKYSALFFLVILVFISLRIVEFLFLIQDKDSFYNLFRSFTYSVEFDLILIAFLSLIGFPLFFGFFLISKKLFYAVFYVLSFILITATILLTQVFHSTHFLLDKTILYFSWKELQIITSGETGSMFNIYLLLYLTPLIVILLSLLLLNPKIKRNKVLFVLSQVFFIGALSLFLFRGELHPSSKEEYSMYETQIHTSKSTYFFESLIEHYFKDKSYNQEVQLDKIKSFQAGYERHFVTNKKNHPLLYKVDQLTKNDWSKHLHISEKTNVVFIFSESLSSSFTGENAHFGSMTPFLDSLAKHSLYWPNMLSITDRTHGIFAATLASLPHGFERGFLNYDGDMPDYISLPKILNAKNYDLNFVYGGWSGFDNYERFLKDNGFQSFIDEGYMKRELNYKKEKQDDSFSWGFHDMTTNKAYFEFLNRRKSDHPYFNIYLTLSLHTPFDIPEKERYIQEAKSKFTHIENSFFEQHKDIISTIYYADQSLKDFFETYKKRDDFEQTIFFIMGDHNLRTLGLKNDMDSYHVPFLIYSPKIHQPKQYNEIISHWDVPATVIDILPDIKLEEYSSLTHWLGDVVNMEKTTRSKKPIFLGTYQGDIVGVVLGKYAYLYENLYSIEDHLNLIKSSNDMKKQELKTLLESYVWLNRHVITKNKLISSLHIKPMIKN